MTVRVVWLWGVALSMGVRYVLRGGCLWVAAAAFADPAVTAGFTWTGLTKWFNLC